MSKRTPKDATAQAQAKADKLAAAEAVRASRTAAKEANAKARADAAQSKAHAVMEATNAKLKEAAKALTGDIDTLTNAMTVAQLTAAAQEIAGHIKAGEEHSAEDFKAAGRRLLEVQKQLREQGGSFDLFLKKYKKELGSRTTCFKYMSIAGGKTTVDEIRAEDRKRAQAQRDRNREAREAVRASRTGSTLSLLPDNSVVETPATPVPGNAGDPVAEAETRMAENAKRFSDDQPAPNVTAMKPWQVLAAGKSWLDDHLQLMDDTAKTELWVYFNRHEQMRRVKRRAA